MVWSINGVGAPGESEPIFPPCIVGARIEDAEDEHGCNGERERDHETGEGGRYSLTLSLFWARRGHRERAHVESDRCFPGEPAWADLQIDYSVGTFVTERRRVNERVAIDLC